MNFDYNQSEIVEFYKKKNIFITGASGFIGKVLVEKLIRTCTDIEKIYVLLRTKKGCPPEQRIEKEFVQCKLFDNVDKKLIESKIKPINGDLTLENLGLSSEDEQKIINEINIVFHVAASVRFDDPLKECVNYNLIGTKYVLDLCCLAKNLDCFVHVSTAYAYCHLKQTKETLYPLKTSPSQVMDICKWMDNKSLEECSKILMEGRPNTYTFTKALAEHYINENHKHVPVAIARPSIVTSTSREPFSGWIDSINGPGGAALLGTLGIARTMYCKPNCIADLIPIDIVTNALIVIAWDTSKYYETNQLKQLDCLTPPLTPLRSPTSKNASLKIENATQEIRIYNIASGNLNPTTWSDFLKYGREIAYKMPSMKMIRLPATAPEGEYVNWYSHIATKFISETLFAFLFDFLLILIGQKAMMVRLVRKMHNAFNLLEYFANRQWNFPCDNLTTLYHKLNKKDRELFNFDIEKIDWRVYIYDFYIGMRRHLMNEQDDNTAIATKRMHRLKLVYALINAVMIFIFVIMLIWLIPMKASSFVMVQT